MTSSPAPADETVVLPDAVLWDMDGTLVATEPYWMAAERSLVESYGLAWSDEDAVAMVGLPLIAAGEIIAAHGVPLSPEEIVERLVSQVAAQLEREVPWQPGARELLSQLAEAGVPNALVTMSYRVLAEKILDSVPGCFTSVVCGDDVTHGKPHPEPFLTAAAKLDVDPTRCVAIEDSLPGISSALASGARTIAVEVMVPVPEVPELSRVASLEDLSLGDLGSIAAGKTIDLLARR